MSLKNILLNEIYRKGYVPIDRIYEICVEQHKKQSNAERRLRASESPTIEPVENENGAIIAYRVKQIPPAPISEPIEAPSLI